MNRIQLLLSTSVLGCAILVQPAFAQDASAPATTSASNQPSTALQEVVVTAEHRTSTAQKTAASISVRSGRDMLLQGRYELSDILEDVPGVVGGAATAAPTTIAGIGTDNPATGLIIRGVQSNTGAGGSSITAAAAAAIYVDDVYNGIGGNYDIDRVEVLRGPQGTLYGRSATAGVVAIHTGDPNTTRFSADGSAEFGDYDLRHWTGEVNVPIINDTLAVRVSANEYDREGYYSAKGGEVSTDDFRVKALWTPTDNFSALLGYAKSDSVLESEGISISQITPTTFSYTPEAVSPPGTSRFNQYWGNFNLNVGPVALTYIPAYRTWYQDATVYNRGPGQNINQYVKTPTDGFLTQELRIRNSDNNSKLKWQAGFLYYDNTLSNVDNLFNLDPTILPAPLPALPPSYVYQSSTHKSTTAEGGFAEATYSFLPETRLTAGVRYDHTQVRNDESYTSILGITQTLTGNQGLRTFDDFTYKVRLEQDLTARNMLYAMISTGASPGDVAITTSVTGQPELLELKAETLTAYEIGSKNMFFGNRLQVNGDLYYNDYGAFQTAGTDITPNAPPPPIFATIAVPMKSYGAELELKARPWDNGTFSVTGSYTNARYGNLGQYADLFSTNVVPGVAPFQGSVAYDHSLAIGSATLLLHGDVRFFSAHDTTSIPQSWAALGAEPYVHVGNEALGDLDATLLFGSHYSITAYARNITDNRFIPNDWGLEAVTPGAGPGAPPIIQEGRTYLSDPRTLGVILSFKY